MFHRLGHDSCVPRKISLSAQSALISRRHCKRFDINLRKGGINFKYVNNLNFNTPLIHQILATNGEEALCNAWKSFRSET